MPAGNLTDIAGNTSAAPFNFAFYVLAGDANRDHHVNLLDFNILAANFNQSDRTFSQGDFNYDGQTNLLDFNILAARFNTALPMLPGTTSLIPPSPESVTARSGLASAATAKTPFAVDVRIGADATKRGDVLDRLYS